MKKNTPKKKATRSAPRSKRSTRTGAGSSLEARVVELEIRDMQKQKTLDDLAELVWEKEQRVAKLEKRVALLTTQVLSGAQEDAQNERPPHY